jgi:uncharacterized membrane protein HdeD (DUF308 family)
MRLCFDVCTVHSAFSAAALCAGIVLVDASCVLDQQAHRWWLLFWGVLPGVLRSLCR